ncbi:MAG: insulinase family protein [Alphaproteobacteria bacterium]|nr:insulinase family protein [Alphaproteobacteria bacterium]
MRDPAPAPQVPSAAVPWRRQLPAEAGGATIVGLQRPGEAAAVYLRFAAGAADERPGEHGAAHLLEHMLFKGTPARGIGQAARDVEALGGDLNAWTSHDELVLHAEVAGGAWQRALDVVVDLARAAILDPDELQRERPVVLEEIAAYAEDADEELAEATQRALWGDHPYGRRVTGSADDVSTLDRASLVAFRARELTPGRLTVVVVADAPPDEVTAEVHRQLGDWAQGGARQLPDPPPPLAGACIARPEGDFDDRAVELAWRGPPADHDDLAALHVLAAILGEACGDRITEALDHEPKVGFAGWASVAVAPLGTSLSLGFRPLPGQTVVALGRVFDLLARLARSTGGRLVARAREMLVADLDFGEQTAAGLAEDLLLHETVHGSAHHREVWRGRLAAVTPDDVRRVAATWLPADRVVLGVLDPEVEDDALLAVLRAPRLAASPARAGLDQRTVAGVRVALLPLDAPVAAVRLTVPGGALRVPERMAGLGAAWSRTVHRGAGRLDGEAFHDALDDLAVELTTTSSAEGLHVSATAPAAHLVDLLDLLGELCCDPHLDDAEWALVRAELLEDARTRGDRAAEVVGDELMRLRFPGHPWRTPDGGTPTTLARIDGRSLQRFHAEHFARGRPVVAVAGRFSSEEVIDALGWLDDLPDPKPPLRAPAWPALAPGVHTVRAGARQALVALLGEGVPVEDVPRRGLEVAVAVLDGQGGRLFHELREVRGLAYDLWIRDEERAGGGLLHLGAATDPRRADEAADALRGALAQLVERPPDADELARARAVIAGREVLAAQRVEHQASRLAARLWRGLAPEGDARRAALEAVTPDQVRDEVARVLDAGFLEVRSLPREGR